MGNTLKQTLTNNMLLINARRVSQLAVIGVQAMGNTLTLTLSNNVLLINARLKVGLSVVVGVQIIGNTLTLTTN